MLLPLILACSGPSNPAEEPATNTAPPSPKTVESPWTGDAFGFSIDATGPLLVGAPEGPLGRVYEVLDEELVLVFEEEIFGAAGFAVARDHTGAAWVGAPLAEAGNGRLYRDGTHLKSGTRALGAHLRVSGNELLASESQAYWLQESFTELQDRLTSSAVWNDDWVLGFAYGSSALQLVDSALGRRVPSDHAGFALCAANFDDDPEEELAVGAPGLGQVAILNPGDSLDEAFWFGPQEGRFGHALACGDGFLLVGAPTRGDQLEGAVWCFEGRMDTWSTEEPLLEGHPWQQAGFSVAASSTLLAAGAPGNAYTPGSVTTWSR